MESENLISSEQLVRSLYKSLYACADHYDEALIDRIHISTPVEDTLVKFSKANKIIFVTGNPGDGKTHVIKKVQNEFPGSMEVILDANVLPDKDLIKAINKAYDKKKGLVVAINEGILLGLAQNQKKRYAWAEEIVPMLLRPYVYDGKEKSIDQIVVIDLTLRNNLAPGIVNQAIDKIAGLGMEDSESNLFENAVSLKNNIIQKRMVNLLDAVGQTGFHSTMRDLLGFLAFMICGGENEDNQTRPNPYFENAFLGGIGSLFDKVKNFDPILKPHPFLDDDLFMANDIEEDWELFPEDEYRTPEDLNTFTKRKRRAYFEHKKGSEILRTGFDEVERQFERLMNKDRSPEYTAIELLNHFFDSSKTTADHLILWFTHQFHAKQARLAASRQTINPNEFKIMHPHLPGHLESAFEYHYPDHVILKHKDMESLSDGLVIDRRFVKMLIEGDKQYGFGTRSLEAHSKISSFYDRIASVCSNTLNIVNILRLDNQDSIRVGVNPGDKTFYLTGV